MSPIFVVENPRASELPSTADAFLDGLPGPTIVRLSGHDRTRTRVVSGTLHGNEPSGLRAIHRVLVEGLVPATDTLFFIGGVNAAKLTPRLSHRFVPGQRDPNRCFKGPFDDENGAMAEAALRLLTATTPELSVDLHNNTGKNPSYAICIALDGPELAIASLFTHRVIRSELKLGTFTEVMRPICASVTIECGQAHDSAADAVAYAGLRRLLTTDVIDPFVVGDVPLEVFVDPIRVELLRGMSLAFGHHPHPERDVTFDPDIDRHNFQTLRAGVALGHVGRDVGWPFVATDDHGVERSRDLFEVDDEGVLRSRASFVPLMMTTHVQIARDDCLFYAVHRRQ